MMKLLVTGANGLLGQKLISLSASLQEISFVATGRGENRNPTGKYEYRQLDVTSREEVSTVLKEINPDVVINCAAMTHVDQCETHQEACWSQNVRALEYLIASCIEANAFLIQLSTDFIFDGLAGPYTEEAVAHPLSYYGKSKLASEDLLKSSPVKSAIVRTVLVYGIAHDMSKSNIILWVKHSLEQGKKIQVINDQWRTPTLAEDLALGCTAIAQKRAEGIFNLSGKDLLTPHEMALKTAHFFKLDASLIEEVDGSVFTQPAQRPARTGFILDKAITELNYNPHSFDEGMAILQKQLSLRSL